MDKSINGQNYRIGKLPARTQFHVARRLMPLLTSLENLPALMALVKDKEMAPRDAAAIFESALTPLAKVLAKMPDEDLDYIINSCFGVCARLTADGKPQPLLAMDGVQFMFADIQLPQMIEICLATVEENMGNFFDLIPAASG